MDPMVQETKRFLSYICPHCLQSVIVERDLFTLAAAPAHIKCPCGHCRNFVALARERKLPEELLAILDSLSIPP